MMFWNKRLREELEKAQDNLLKAIQDLRSEAARARQAERAEESLRGANDSLVAQINLLYAEIDVLKTRNPPSNVAVAVHRINGFDVVQGQDGSLWARAGDAWLNWSLPDTTIPMEAPNA